jgi:uncharacterized membrane protein YhfC
MPLHWGAFLVTFLLTAGGPVAAAIWVRQKLGVPLRVFEVAAIFYLLNLAVQLPVFGLLGRAGLHGGLVFAAVLAPAIYAVSEESMRYLSFRATGTMRGQRTADGALMAGLGHGGMEAIIFALSLAWTIGVATFAPDALRAIGVDAGRTLDNLTAFSATFTISRLCGVVTHLGFATLIVMAYRSSVLFLPLAMLAHLAVVASTSALQASSSLPIWLLVLAAWAVASAAFVALVRRGGRLHPGQPHAETVAATQPA